MKHLIKCVEPKTKRRVFLHDLYGTLQKTSFSFGCLLFFFAMYKFRNLPLLSERIGNAYTVVKIVAKHSPFKPEDRIVVCAGRECSPGCNERTGFEISQLNEVSSEENDIVICADI